MVAVLNPGEAPVRRWVMPEVGRPPTDPDREKAGAGPTVHEIEAIQAQARDEGFATGHREGLAAAQREVQQRVRQLDAVFAAAARPLANLDAQTERVLAELAMVVARRVLYGELRATPELVVRAVEQAAAAMPPAAQALRVHVHPDDLALLAASPAGEGHYEYVADPTLARGGCRLESARSQLDARVETRLAAVIDAVLADAPARAAP